MTRWQKAGLVTGALIGGLGAERRRDPGEWVRPAVILGLCLALALGIHLAVGETRTLFVEPSRF